MSTAQQDALGDIIRASLDKSRAVLIKNGPGAPVIQEIPYDVSVLNIERDLLKHLDAQPFPDEWLIKVRDALDSRLGDRQKAREQRAAQAVVTNAGLDTPENCIRMDEARSDRFSRAIYELSGGFYSLQAVAQQMPDKTQVKGEIDPKRTIEALAAQMEEQFEIIFGMMNGDDIAREGNARVSDHAL